MNNLLTKLTQQLSSRLDNVHLNGASLPLMINTKMPDDIPYDQGHVNFALESIRLSKLDQISIDDTQYPENWTLCIGLLEVIGNYGLELRESPKIDMDTAGTMMDFNDPLHSPEPAGADEEPSLPEAQRESYLNQAREQRTRLMDTKNGQQLMARYNEHNEIYNEAFQSNQLLRRLWKAKGATSEMAADTSSSVKENAVVNQKDKKYANGMTYNSNAFTQQLNVAVASAMAQPNFNLFEALQENKYTNAGTAALSFGKAVNTTGNSKDEVTELKSEQVYGSVDDHSGDLPATSIDELGNVLQQGMGDGGAAVEAGKKGWIILDEEDRDRVRDFITKTLIQQEAQKTQKTILWKNGTCKSSISGITVIMRNNEITQINIPTFDFHIDDSDWTGELGDQIRERLSQIYFLRYLLQDRLETSLKSLVSMSLLN